jgi:ferritin-like metal-binding protein YciE
MADLNARDTKVVQYLNEALAKEKELETALTMHIGMTTRAPYKKRLQQHLRETKGHARGLERRIKQPSASLRYWTTLVSLAFRSAMSSPGRFPGALPGQRESHR